MASLDELRSKGRDELLKLTVSHLGVFERFRAVFKGIESNLSNVKSRDDREALQSVLSDYNDYYANLKQLKDELDGFSDQDLEDQNAVMDVSLEVLASAIYFVYDLPERLMKTSLGDDVGFETVSS